MARGSRFADTRIRKALGLLRARPNKDVNIDVLRDRIRGWLAPR